MEVLKLLVAHGAKLEWTPNEIATQPQDAKGKGPPAGAGPTANVGQTAVLATMKGGKGPAIQGGPGYTRTGPPPYREPGSRDPLEALKVLLAAGANPNVKGPDGSTPLHSGRVQAQQVAMIRALAASGASMDAVNKDNLTPLLLAEKAPPAPVAGAGVPNGTGAPVAKVVDKDSREDVIAALRELMHLGPNDPAPQPPPASVKPAPRKARASQTHACQASKRRCGSRAVRVGTT